MNQNQTESKSPSVEEPRNEWLDGTPCSVSYLEGALAKAKTWSIHNSSYPHHTEEHKEWLRGYADYPEKFTSPNVKRIHSGAGLPKQSETPAPLDGASCYALF